MKKFSITFILFQFILNFGYSQEITGDWYGIADFQGTKLRINLHVTGNDSGYTAIFDSPEQEAFELPADTLIVSGNSFNLKFGSQNYEGIISRELQKIYGAWKYPGGSTVLNLGRESISPPEGSIILIKEQYDKTETQVTMRDGIRLFTSIYTPKDKTEPHPILIIRTPYNSEPNEDNYSYRLGNLTHLLKEKYIIVFQDVRGRYMSEGKFMDVRPYDPDKKKKEIDENSDTFDTIDWLIQNVANNNGNVGVLAFLIQGFIRQWLCQMPIPH